MPTEDAVLAHEHAHDAATDDLIESLQWADRVEMLIAKGWHLPTLPGLLGCRICNSHLAVQHMVRPRLPLALASAASLRRPSTWI